MSKLVVEPNAPQQGQERAQSPETDASALRAVESPRTDESIIDVVRRLTSEKTSAATEIMEGIETLAGEPAKEQTAPSLELALDNAYGQIELANGEFPPAGREKHLESAVKSLRFALDPDNDAQTLDAEQLQDARIALVYCYSELSNSELFHPADPEEYFRSAANHLADALKDPADGGLELNENDKANVAASLRSCQEKLAKS